VTKHYVALIIRDVEGRYLTLRHAKKVERQWRFPGGKVDSGEFPIMAAARELFEELGVIAYGLNLIKVTEDHFTDAETWKGHFFEVLSYSGEIRLMEPEKHNDWTYMDVFDLRNANAHPEYEVAMEQTYTSNATVCIVSSTPSTARS